MILLLKILVIVLTYKMNDNFCHLHLHSSYSFTDGYGLPEQYVNRAVELGQPGLGVTDHGNISSHYKWYKQCNKAGIKPILGVEFYIVENDEKVRSGRSYYHLTVLAKNNKGYNNLTKLVTKSWCENFYYKPQITFQDLFDNQEGLIVMSGCLSSPVMARLMEGGVKEADEMLELFNSKLDDFYMEVQPIKFEKGLLAYKRLLKLYNDKWKEKGLKLVATNDCHYTNKEHSKVQEILLCVQTNDTMDNPNHWKFDQDDFYLKSREEMRASLNDCHPDFDFTESLDNTVVIMESIDFTFPKAKPIKFPMPEEEKIAHFHDLCNKGMVKRRLEGSNKLDLDLAGIAEKDYRERLEYEIDLIIKKDFVDYFLVITDLVQWAKKKGILVGPARGSAAGSLACYVLAITEVDPMRYELLFERFIDLNREDLPDIDLDFEDARRHEVKEYLESKYGRNKVGNLPVFAAFKGKSAIDDVGRVFKIPFSVLDKVKNAIIERSGGDSRASFTLEDTFTSDVFEYPKIAIGEYPDLHYAVDLEGQWRQMGQHAAGVVISNTPITDFCALYKVKDSYVISMDYKDASDTGLLKIDILGLNTLTVISNALRLIKERTGKKIDIYKLALDDPKVYQGFCDGKLFGVFQFDGQAVNQVCRQIMPRDFDSLSAISALARPGPLNSGSTTMYIQRRAGKEKVEYPHPVMEPFTKETYGIVVYQEQVMKTMREVGKMSWKDTSEIRKLISRSQGVEKFNTFKDKFAIGAKENGMDDEHINKIWDSICTFGSWAFNKSHSVSYTVISYWTMWLKVYYPMEFYSSIMALTEHDDKKKKILKEYLHDGFKLLPVDINRSKEHFSIDGNFMRIGFEDIKGIGSSRAQKAVIEQPYNSYTDFAHRSKMTKSSIQSLVNLGAFDDVGNKTVMQSLFGDIIKEYEKQDITFAERFNICPWDMEFGIEKNWLPMIKRNISFFKKEPTNISTLKEMDNAEDIMIYGIVYDKNLRDAREVSLSKGKNFDINKYKIVHLLKNDLRKWFRGNEWISQWALNNYIKRNNAHLVVGEDYVIEEQYQFANFILEDDTDFITVRLSPIAFPMYGKMIFERLNAEDPIIIRGKMGSGIRMFFANKIVSLKEFKEKNEK